MEVGRRKGREVECYKNEGIRERNQSTTLLPLETQCRGGGHGSEKPEVKLRGGRIHSWEWLFIPTNIALRRLKPMAGDQLRLRGEFQIKPNYTKILSQKVPLPPKRKILT